MLCVVLFSEQLVLAWILWVWILLVQYSNVSNEYIASSILLFHHKHSFAFLSWENIVIFVIYIFMLSFRDLMWTVLRAINRCKPLWRWKIAHVLLDCPNTNLSKVQYSSGFSINTGQISLEKWRSRQFFRNGYHKNVPGLSCLCFVSYINNIFYLCLFIQLLHILRRVIQNFKICQKFTKWIRNTQKL